MTVAERVYNALVLTAPFANRRVTGGIWKRVWDRAGWKYSGPVNTTIHGRRAVVNFGHTYAVLSRRFKHYNAPLVDLVRRTARDRCRPVTVVDVGASIGDTVMLMDEACPSLVAQYHCVDGDAEFFEYLKRNLGGRPDCTLYKAMLSAGDDDVPELVRTHGGTASAQGTTTRPARPLDTVLADTISSIDVLKIDTDGFDGRVLAGSTAILRESRPAVIFEWHPLLYDRTGNDPMEPFEVLHAAGYRELEWYDKFGVFSHTSAVDDHAVVREMYGRCVAEPALDVHFDIVARPSD